MDEQVLGATIRPLPELTKVEIQDLSLYQNRRHIAIALGRGVFCLAGANGLGKSTFLSAVNFALTGVVADPTRNYRSVREYYKESLDYSSRYFDGRIRDDDRETAQVSIEFEVGGNRYRITRGFFEPTELRELDVRNSSGELIVGREAVDGDDRHKIYVSHVLRDMRLSTFEQLTFLQHFVLTFDERRHLLFWDAEVAEQALYLAFGMDADLAERADQLRRKIERTESQARNLQYQATVARNRIQDLKKLSPSPSGSDTPLRDEYDRLRRDRDERRELADAQLAAANDARLSTAQKAAEQQMTQRRYDEAFQARLKERVDPRRHPLVHKSLANDSCEVCGTSDTQVATAISERLDRARCPLCDTDLSARGSEPPDVSTLAKIDDQLASARAAVIEADRREARLAEEAEATREAAEVAQDRVIQFENDNDTSLFRLESTADASSAFAATVRSLEAERDDALSRRDKFRADRDRARNELRPIQDQLLSAYEDAELYFVPLFTSLAKQFLGLDLDIQLVRKGKDGFELVLEVESTRRRHTTQLSESQRFFVDIALRMALAQYMSGMEHPACLYVDTPEGSLDIAYEARAGTMFSAFVNQGNRLVMTANINTSQLLVRLAERTNRDRMTLVRMTEWTPLSEVQADSEDLFDEAFDRIERIRMER